MTFFDPKKMQASIAESEAAKAAKVAAGGLDAGSTNAGLGKGSETSTKVAGGMFGLGKEDLAKHEVNSAAWASQAGGVKQGVNDRYQAVTGAGNVAPQAAGAQAGDVAMNPEMRQRQSALADMLYQQAMGNGPSAAQSQLQAGTAAAINSQMAMARSSGDPNAMRQAQFNAASIQQQGANQAAQLRAQEMQAGRQLYTGQLEGARGQDLGQRQQDMSQGQFNANLGQQNQQFNAGLQMDQKKFVEDAASKYLSMGYSMAEADRAAAIDFQKTQQTINANYEAQKLGQNNAANNALPQFVGTVLETGGKIAMAASDERAKTNVEDGGKDIRGFLDAISANKYEYKDSHKDPATGGGKGTYVSPMAQELEKTALGRDMVREDETGTKVVDYGKGFGAMLAALADTNKRLKKLGV